MFNSDTSFHLSQSRSPKHPSVAQVLLIMSTPLFILNMFMNPLIFKGPGLNSYSDKQFLLNIWKCLLKPAFEPNTHFLCFDQLRTFLWFYMLCYFSLVEKNHPKYTVRSLFFRNSENLQYKKILLGTKLVSSQGDVYCQKSPLHQNYTKLFTKVSFLSLCYPLEMSSLIVLYFSHIWLSQAS